MKKYPEKYRKQNTPEQHLIFIRHLPCCRCHKTNPWAWQFEGNMKTALPLCEDCLGGVNAGWTVFADEEQSVARKLAHDLWNLSGDIFGGNMAVLVQEGKIFK